MRWRHFLPLLGAWLVCGLGLRAAEVIPPAPPNHFNDYAGIVPVGTGQVMNQTLEDFERETSNQVVVAIYPHMQSDSSIEDYTVRVAQAWGVGLKGKKNGVVLFIFSQDRKLYIQVGYGLEGRLTDARCKQIIDNEITPSFHEGDYNKGIQLGIFAILASIRGEYQGTGRTVADGRGSNLNPASLVVVILFLGIAFIRWTLLRNRGSSVYGRNGRVIFPGGGWSGGGGSFGGGGGGGGSFSGGGGSFGGGGAGGSW